MFVMFLIDNFMTPMCPPMCNLYLIVIYHLALNVQGYRSQTLRQEIFWFRKMQNKYLYPRMFKHFLFYFAVIFQETLIKQLHNFIGALCSAFPSTILTHHKGQRNDSPKYEHEKWWYDAMIVCILNMNINTLEIKWR